MNVWKLTAAKNLVKFTEELRPEEEKIRVRVTKVFVNDEDGLLFQGTKKTKYPIVPGRFAVGLVADDKGGALFPKDSRVLLHYFLRKRTRERRKKISSRTPAASAVRRRTVFCAISSMSARMK